MTSLPLVFDAPARRRPTPRHWADLDDTQRRAAVIELGWPAFRADQLSRQYYGRLTRDPSAMSDLPSADRDGSRGSCSPTCCTRSATSRPTAARPARRCGGCSTAPLWRACSCATRPAPFRWRRTVRADHRLHLQPGRLRHGLPLLRHRPGRSDPQPVHGRDRRPGRGRRRDVRERRTHRWRRPALQRGLHGHGRAAGQLQPRHRRCAPAGRPGPVRARHLAALDHAVHRRPRTGDRPAHRRGPQRHPGRLTARPR